MIRNNTDNHAELVVTLSNSDDSEIDIPTTVTIPENETFVTFDINAVDDDLLDGTQTVTITASAAGYVSSFDTLDVTDREALTVTIADGSISEHGGSTTATVTRADQSGDLTVNLMSDDTTEATVVESVVIPDGSTVSPTFTIAAVDDLIVDGTITVTITASAPAYEDGITTIDVLDHETWTNPLDKNDANLDGFVTPGDVRVIVNELNRSGPRQLPERDGSSPPPPFYDANQDGFITPHDVLVIIRLALCYSGNTVI